MILLLALLAQDEVTVESLLDEMADLQRLARPANYACRQFSSYDRASNGRKDWFANNDAGHYLRVEKNGEHVLAEAEGPGAIVRLWSANPAGVLRIYLDGKVALQHDFAKLTQGKIEPFTEPFGGMRGRGCNLYFPFPYEKSMKVTTSKGGQYYHVNYRAYAAGTRVRTFDKPPAEKMAKVAELLRAPSPKFEAKSEFRGSLELAGPATIARFELSKIDGDLRRATVKMTFDGELTVWSPLPDFFGTSPDGAAYTSYPLATWRCDFPMPFAKSAKLEVEGAKVEGAVYTRAGADEFRFYAWWRGKASVKTRPMSDWTLLAGEGSGRYVGTTLYVRNPVKAWWGEGDEKVFVDGEEFPSTFGTGTEDYFGYAWCDTAVFEHAYHSQSRCEGPANRGTATVTRMHVLDDIPFTRSIRFDMEIWHWADCAMSYATVAYWYARPGFKHGFEPAPDAERAILALPEIKGVAGAIEGEALKILEHKGEAHPQDMEGFGDGWSRGSHLWWRDAKQGDTLRLEFASTKEGKQTLVLAMTKAPDYGIVKISVNGAVIAEEVDLYDAKVVPTGEREFAVELKSGANELKVEIVGTNPKANPKNYMFGLDYLRIK